MPRLDDVESKYGTLRDRVKQFDVRRPIRSLHMLRKLPFNGVTIARADDELNHDQAVPDHDVENVGLVDPQVTHDFYHAVASNPRFSDIEMGTFLEQFDGEEQTQFAAVTYLLPSGALVVAYRGTDDSLVGWKEDFNMAFSIRYRRKRPPPTIWPESPRCGRTCRLCSPAIPRAAIWPYMRR